MSGRPPIGALDIPTAPVVQDGETRRGLRLLVTRRPTVPMVELRMSFPLPASVVARPAASMILSESLVAGTDRHDREELAAAVDRLGGSLGASHDGDRFVLGGAVLASNLGELLDLLAEVLVSATFLPDEVRADRSRIADETLIARTQPEVIAGEALRRRMYAPHPAATGLPSPGSIRRVAASALKDLAGLVLTPASGHMVVVGDLEPAQTAALVEDRLGPWLDAAGDAPATDLPPLPAAKPGPLEIVDRPGSVQSNVLIGLAAPRRADASWPAASLANLVFGGLFTSRFVVNLRERHGYSYSPRSSIGHARAGSTLVVRADVGRDVTAASLVESRYELARMAVGGIEDEELESARRYALGTLSFLTATQAGLAATLSSLVAGGVGPGYLASHPAAVAKVSKAEVEEAAHLLFGLPGATTVVVGDAGEIAGSLSAVDDVAVRPAAS